MPDFHFTRLEISNFHRTSKSFFANREIPDKPTETMYKNSRDKVIPNTSTISIDNHQALDATKHKDWN